MTKEQIHIGAWIIWDGDTYPRPRLIIGKEGELWRVNNVYRNDMPYKPGKNDYTSYSDVMDCNLLKARFCTEDEIPKEFKIEGQLITYQIY